MPKPLVIVESPAKAKTIAGYLGPEFVVESSVGHVRDLPDDPSEIPAAYRGEPWARLGIDVDNDFKPLYVVSGRKKDVVKRLKALLKDASELYLATDEDREGESIAWHLREVLSPRVPVKRMVFHEITAPAIRRAVEETRDLDMPLVDAQETRRLLDRLYGFEVSPVLWRRIKPRLSAGRVQSVATRMIVERERERMRFRAAGWWDLEASFTARGSAPFSAALVVLDGRRLVTGKDFTQAGELKAGADVARLDEEAARALAGRLRESDFAVRTVEEKPYRRSPYAPFMTSTLQQEAGRQLRFDSRRTMQVAQRLYENGFITYMRTDSTSLSEAAVAAARRQAARLYGAEYVPEKPRQYARKVKNAQEAHEAVRPAGDDFRTPDQVAGALGRDELRLYDLIWKRTVASQMSDAVGNTVQVRVGATSSAGEDVELATSGKVITFPGFFRAYVEGSDDPEAVLEDREVRLPALAPGDALDLRGLEPKSHTTQPPPRYTDASLVKALEERGVGRPSTYATIISTIQDRGYAWKRGQALVPTFTAFAVVNLLEQHFGQLVDYDFTARLEDELDEIASRRQERVPWLARFYFGGEAPGLKDLVTERLDQIDPRAINSIPIGTDGEGREVVVRVGRYGPYLQRGDDRAAVPEELPPDELTLEKAAELLDAPSGDRVIGEDPATGLAVIVRAGRYGPYVQLGEADGGSKAAKPVTASLFKTMAPESVTLDDALRLLTLPRVVGTDPATGEEIVAANGRYGPYLKKGNDSRSLTSEEQLFSVTIDEALAIYAQPKQRRGQAAAGPLRELGADPATGAPMVIKDGRFGPYITDGEYNATVPRGESVEEISPERAAELLADKRAKGPAPKKAKRTARTAKAPGRAKATTKSAGQAAKTAGKASGKATGRAAKTAKATGRAAKTAEATKSLKAAKARAAQADGGAGGDQG
ncbi:MAG TPA: type I DNA topoisomerase [Acidimicrobiales bacterium]|jgi:DNA topoisomerase I|nr:type I DNA topoisomerase [Acidimicrobiales bacterium]